jgi:hypothetical protein
MGRERRIQKGEIGATLTNSKAASPAMRIVEFSFESSRTMKGRFAIGAGAEAG